MGDCYDILGTADFTNHPDFLKFYDYYDFPIQKFTNQISLNVEMI